MQKFKSGEKFYDDIKNGLGHLEDMDGTKALGLENLFKKLKNSAFLKDGLSMLPYATGALGLFKFFTAGGKQGFGELVPSPVIVKTNYSFSGSISQEYKDFTSMAFRTPGSITGTAPIGELAYYNEVMGVFNLLKTPKIITTTEYTGIMVRKDGLGDTAPQAADLASGEQGIIVPIDGPGGDDPSNNFFYKTTFTLADDIEYVLNPAAKLDIQEMQFFLSIKDEYGKEQMIPISAGPGTVHLVSQGVVLPKVAGEIMVVLNLKRQNAGPNTQNILLSLKFPTQSVNLMAKESGTAIIKANSARIDEFCNSATYKQTGRFPTKTSYAQAVERLAQEEREAEAKANSAQTANQIFETYPNPTQGIFTVSLPTGIEGGAQVEVFNMIGEKVHSLSADGLSQSMEIDITGRPAGLYMVRVSHNGQVHSSKIVLE